MRFSLASILVRRLGLGLAGLLLAAAPAAAAPARQADEPARGHWPDGVFVQYGRSVGDTHAFTAGALWRWQRHWALWGGQAGGHWEVALGHWNTKGLGGRDTAAVTELGIIPTLRWRAQGGASPWFVEGAIGLSVVAPLYQSQGRRFSTMFNFNDHLGLGRDLGRHDELLLRLTHYSNGGLRQPNPGENFWQLRYTHWWP